MAEQGDLQQGVTLSQDLGRRVVRTVVKLRLMLAPASRRARGAWRRSAAPEAASRCAGTTGTQPSLASTLARRRDGPPGYGAVSGSDRIQRRCQPW